MNTLEAALADQGYITRAQALDCGETDRSLQLALRGRALVRLRRGMYVSAEAYADLNELERHVLLARVVVAGQRGEVALTGPSAAALHGYRLHGHDLDVVHLIRLDRGASRTEAGVQHHIATSDITGDVEISSGLLVLSRARTVWEVARLSTLEGGVCTADSALQQDEQIVGSLRELIGHYAHHPGSRRARIALSLARPQAESAGESVTRVQCYRWGIPEPTLQFVVRDDAGFVGKSDFYWEECRHLAEFDGKVKYERLLEPGETASDCVFREKRREDRMRATRRGMSRFVWSEVMPARSRTTMGKLQAALEQSRSLYLPSRTIIL